ncbi:serine/threonine protein kinase [Sulfitobacter geojensis]|uniref:serine/threonine protein kinase n=1 Tax=Sulfitobacter geojensis TaxID=1342299 RepID=UPI00193B702D|nr:serine/threonine-protein kinase [Sulfitobacter geojensis]MBM1824563.1 serine/threonine protein kinase [Sulfitobacter geojensis]
MTDPRPGDAFQIGDVLNNTYRIEALLGRGGTSDVYRARNEISGRLIAIKVLKAEFSGNEDFLVLMTREEEIREIRHDAIVRYSENHRTSEGLVYLVMDYIEGPGLDARLKEGPMPAEDLLTLCKRVGEGLKVAHDRSIVHRDLSPDNIILRDGDPAKAVVIDFGIAKDTNPGAETIVGNEFAGKYAYAAPEQLSGNTDARSDIYSLGALLLANFRGKKPEIGNNPMEVVKNKTMPLDTTGVPEPLKGLVDRMTAPLPDARFQSMDEVLAYIASGGASDALSDETVIVSPPKAAETTPEPAVDTPAAKPTSKPEPKKPAAAKAKPAKGSSAGLIAAALAVVVIGGGAAAWFGGVFGAGEPEFPAAVPFSLIISDPENAAATASGFVPSAQMQDALSKRITDLGGTASLTLASGDIAESWGADVMAVVDDVAALDDWQLSLVGNEAAVSGSTTDADLLARLNEKYDAAWPGALSGTFDVSLTSLFLDAVEVEYLLAQYADCGPLKQASYPGPVGYGPEEAILISGTLAGASTVEALQEAIEDIADERFVVIDAEVLNPTLCLVENYLPQAPTSDIEIVFTEGIRGENVPDGRFLVGQNPVIDLMIPESLTTGYISTSILDVSGNVFHLLPNNGRSDNSVETLREGRNGKVPLRVTFDMDNLERNEGELAFTIDASSLGKSKILVLHSYAPLFRQMRPRQESAVGFTEALSERSADELIQSLDSWIFTTAEE